MPSDFGYMEKKDYRFKGNSNQSTTMSNCIQASYIETTRIGELFDRSTLSNKRHSHITSPPRSPFIVPTDDLRHLKAGTELRKMSNTQENFGQFSK